MRSLSEFYRLAEREQVTVDLFWLTRRESMSLLDADGRCHIAIDPRRLRSERDERTKLVHELGHCLTGSFYSRGTDYDGRLRQENRADKWAIAQTVPETALDEAVAAGHTELWDLADFFDVGAELMRKAVCWYTYGNLAAELYF